MGDGNTRISQPADPGRNAGNNPDRYAMLNKGLTLFTAASEHKGIAALQAQHAFAVPRQIHQLQRDVALFGRRLAAALACVDHFGFRARPAQDFGRDQRVMHDNIRLHQRIHGVNRQKAGISGASAAQPDPAGFQRGPVMARQNRDGICMRVGHAPLMHLLVVLEKRNCDLTERIGGAELRAYSLWNGKD